MNPIRQFADQCEVPHLVLGARSAHVAVGDLSLAEGQVVFSHGAAGVLELEAEAELALGQRQVPRLQARRRVLLAARAKGESEEDVASFRVVYRMHIRASGSRNPVTVTTRSLWSVGVYLSW